MNTLAYRVAPMSNPKSQSGVVEAICINARFALLKATAAAESYILCTP